MSDSPLPSGPPGIYLTIAGTAITLTLAATLLPTYSALRSHPAKATTASMPT